MGRFINTNYELYIDYFKCHSEFVAQKYFSRSFNAHSLAKTGVQDEKIIVGSSFSPSKSMMDMEGILPPRASVIGKANHFSSKVEDEEAFWSIFDFIQNYSYVA